MEPIYSALYARSNCATARNRNKCKHPHYYCVLQETKLYFIELSWQGIKMNSWSQEDWKHVTLALCQESWEAEFQWLNEVLASQCTALSPTWFWWSQKLCVECEAFTMSLGTLEGPWPKSLSTDICGGRSNKEWLLASPLKLGEMLRQVGIFL